MTKSADDLRDDFIALLDGRHLEQVYQTCLEENTRLIAREFVQNHGVHLSMVFRKVSFGADYKTDFFYFSKSSDDWNAVFIEIEKPQSRFCKDKSNDFHPDFVAALQQINRWRAWFLRPGNQEGFLSAMTAVRVPITMTRNPTYNKYVLVFGRRAEYSRNDQRRALIKAQETDDFKIISFDSLVEALGSKHELYVAVRRNSYIDILGDELVDDGIFGWMDPTQLRVSVTLRDRLANGPPSNIRRQGNDGNLVEALAHAAPRVRVRT